MKTAELIARLQEADPSGDLDVAIDGGSPYMFCVQPAYYDGRPHIMVEDPTKRPYWSIVGAKILETGYKLSIQTLRIQDVLPDFPDLPIEASPSYDETIATWRAEAREL